ncbi:MAG: fumarylacetoacetate hydrolase family protein [Chloroherpetonaceae bacterium]|nr:fumarylacetoacetate hydrolase family protein [Chloroherpetonaceae bacterium]
MKLGTYIDPISGKETVGILEDGWVFETAYHKMLTAIESTQGNLSTIKKGNRQWRQSEVLWKAALPHPKSFRDFFAFETHIKNARKKRGLEVPPEWYQFPVFYFSNHQAIIGPYDEVKKPSKSSRFDYELELALVIGKECRNVKALEAEQFIAGYTILNDWSLRDIQMEEVKVGLGPAKGKDFATTLGRELVTPDELQTKVLIDENGLQRFDLEMEVFVNGKKYGGGNFKSIYYTFGQMIERASEDATLFPGDLIGSGTVGTGCLLELDNAQFPFLEKGDLVEMRIESIGELRNRVV